MVAAHNSAAATAVAVSLMSDPRPQPIWRGFFRASVSAGQVCDARPVQAPVQ
jgi:hypothetical protein